MNVGRCSCCNNWATSQISLCVVPFGILDNDVEPWGFIPIWQFFFLISWTTFSFWRQAYSDPQGFTCVGTGSSRLVTVSRLVSARDSHPHSSTCHVRPHLQITDESQQEQPVNSGARQHRLVSIHIFPLLWLVGRNAYGNASDFCSGGACYKWFFVVCVCLSGQVIWYYLKLSQDCFQFYPFTSCNCHLTNVRITCAVLHVVQCKMCRFVHRQITYMRQQYCGSDTRPQALPIALWLHLITMVLVLALCWTDMTSVLGKVTYIWL